MRVSLKSVAIIIRTFTLLPAYVFAIVFLLLLSACPNFSYAAEGALTPEYEECTTKHFDDAGFAQCGKEEIKRQEALLTAAWQQAIDNVKQYAAQNKQPMCKDCGPGTIELLEQEQNAWRKWQASACEYLVSGLFAGPDEVLGYPSCKAQIIADRVMSLHRLSNWLEKAMRH